MKHLKLFILIFMLIFAEKIALYSAPKTQNSTYFGLSGGCNITEKNGNFSLLVGYDRHFEGTPEFTLGFLMEGIFKENFNLMLGIPIGFYPFEAIKLWIAPCYVFGIGKTKPSVEDIINYESAELIEHIKYENQFALKFGGEYNYHFNNTNFSMIPFIDGTLVGKDFIIGLGVKFRFYF